MNDDFNDDMPPEPKQPEPEQSLPVVHTPLPMDVNPETLIASAIERAVPVETMEKLLAMRRELRAEAAKAAFYDALSAFQAQCPTIQKLKKVYDKSGKLRYSYAPLESVVAQVKGLLQAHGFSYTLNAVVKLTEANKPMVEAICNATHRAGHSVPSSFEVPIDADAYMGEAQKFASALTYCKRYAFQNAFGIMTGEEDDDATIAGDAASRKFNFQADQPTVKMVKTPAAPPAPPTPPAPAPAKQPSMESYLKAAKTKLLKYAATAPWAWWKACVELGLIPQINSIDEAPANELFPVDVFGTWEENSPLVAAQFQKIQAKQEEIIEQCAADPKLQRQIELYYAAVATAVAPTRAQQQAAAAAAIDKPKEDEREDEPWRAVAIHFGANAGVTLGTLTKNKLFGWWANWQPKPYKGKVSDADAALRQALDEAGEHYEFTKQD